MDTLDRGTLREKTDQTGNLKEALWTEIREMTRGSFNRCFAPAQGVCLQQKYAFCNRAKKALVGRNRGT